MKADAPNRKPALVFYSYAHEDERHCATLITYLKTLERQGVIRGWHDREIVAGSDWRESINEQLDAADIILLLISMSFIASDFCWGEEMTRALERHEAGDARVIPVIVRPGDYVGVRFKDIQALPKDGKAITLWSNRDLAWLDVAKGIRRAVEELSSHPSDAGKKPKNKKTISQKTKAPASPLLRDGSLNKTGAFSTTRGGRPGRLETYDIAAIAKAENIRRAGEPNRTIYDAKKQENLPGEVVRVEGGPPARDRSVNEAYDALGAAYNFFREVFGRDSIDGKGGRLEATVHYGRNFANAFWTGKHMVFGDGDGAYFNRFTIAPDIAAKEYAMGIVRAETQLEYWEQSGAIFQSFAIVMASLVKQYSLGQKASEASWLIGEGLLNKKVNGRALLSLAEPGTAFDDPKLGKDNQPAHMRDYITTTDDNGGIHYNSGILNRAFYLAAIALGGYSWEKAGRIWYEAMKDKRLKPKARFSDLTRITFANAQRLYGRASDEAQAVKISWEEVGIK